MSWKEEAACKDMDIEIFFERRHLLLARSTCAGCPVRELCLEDALYTGSVGVWGGLTVDERKDILNDNS
jgi:hypothetical protein